MPITTSLPTTTITYSGGIVKYVVPVTGLYDIIAYGAQGGLGGVDSGGIGAEIGGDFMLTAGEVLSIAVGGRGRVNVSGPLAGGGGGGSFLVGPDNTPLIIAGGGGGGGSGLPSKPAIPAGGNGQTTTDGQAGSVGSILLSAGAGGAGGTRGNGGSASGTRHTSMAA